MACNTGDCTDVATVCANSASEPLGTTSAEALACNASTIDKVVNGSIAVTTRTGSTLLSLEQLQALFGFGLAPFTFTTGGTLESINLLVSNDPVDGFLYKYIGDPNNIPLVIPPLFDPTASSDWQAFTATVHNLLSGRSAVGAHDAIYDRVTTIAEIASGVFDSSGLRLFVADRGAVFVITLGGTANASDILNAGGGNTAVLPKSQTMQATWFGAGGNTVGTPQDIEWRRVFEATKDPLVSKMIQPVGPWYVDNSGGSQDVGGDCVYEHEGKIHFTNNDQLVFESSNVNNITWSIKVFGLNESTTGFLGGGYVRFTDCDNLTIDDWAVSNHAWDGLKLSKCTNSVVRNGNGNYGKSTAVTLEGCRDVDVHNNTLNSNGRNSSNDAFADMPVGWSGSLVGRGVTLVAHSDGTPCRDCDVYHNRAQRNSEYGIRAFGESPLIGNVDCDVYRNRAYDNGAPAGTYGGAIGLPAKGIDVLLNGSTVPGGDSLRLRAMNNRVKRTFDFGTPISIAGTNPEATGNNIVLEGAAIHLLSAIQLFNAKTPTVGGNVSTGSFRHLAQATGVENVIVQGELALDCKEFVQNFPGGDFNVYRSNRAFHTTSSVAIVGENGIDMSGTGNIDSNLFVGFFEGINTSGAAAGKLSRNETISSVSVGLRNNAINSPDLFMTDNAFDSANPKVKSVSLYESAGAERAGFSQSNVIPTTGYFRRGAYVQNVGSTVATIKGWKRLTTGTAHVLNVDWKEDVY